MGHARRQRAAITVGPGATTFWPAPSSTSWHPRAAGPRSRSHAPGPRSQLLSTWIMGGECYPPPGGSKRDPGPLDVDTSLLVGLVAPTRSARAGQQGPGAVASRIQTNGVVRLVTALIDGAGRLDILAVMAAVTD